LDARLSHKITFDFGTGGVLDARLSHEIVVPHARFIAVFFDF
jgi:hypothetical protein